MRTKQEKRKDENRTFFQDQMLRKCYRKVVVGNGQEKKSYSNVNVKGISNQPKALLATKLKRFWASKLITIGQ